eukprot:m.89502 g.89502  ORF g.89502 m.89502 type:complete len:202 (+) comp8416_c0_seq3:147-752(+)
MATPIDAAPAALTFRSEPAHHGARRVHVLDSHGRPASMAAVRMAFADETFALAFRARLLAECPASGQPFFFESKRFREDSPAEFMLVPAPALATIAVDRHTFASKFNSLPADVTVTTVRNLGGDANLVIPRPTPSVSYRHLLEFLQAAPREELIAFWRECARNWQPRSYMSTSGLGVYWLHMRFDTYPKYYQTREYVESDH